MTEYVHSNLPVEIDAPTHFSSRADKVCAAIRSRYSYGEPVRGTAIVTMKEVQGLFLAHDIDTDNLLTKTVSVDGKASVAFDIQIDSKLDFRGYSEPRVFEIVATVVEELAERNYTARKEIIVHDKRLKLAIIDRRHDFVPAVLLETSVRLSQHDNSPITFIAGARRDSIGKTVDRKKEHVNYCQAEVIEDGVVGVRVENGAAECSLYLTLNHMGEERDIGYYN